MKKWHCSLEWHFNHNMFPPKIRWYESREYQDLKPLKQRFANLESFLLQLKAYGINAHLLKNNHILFSVLFFTSLKYIYIYCIQFIQLKNTNDEVSL